MVSPLGASWSWDGVKFEVCRSRRRTQKLGTDGKSRCFKRSGDKRCSPCPLHVQLASNNALCAFSFLASRPEFSSFPCFSWRPAPFQFPFALAFLFPVHFFRSAAQGRTQMGGNLLTDRFVSPSIFAARDSGRDQEFARSYVKLQEATKCNTG